MASAQAKKPAQRPKPGTQFNVAPGSYLECTSRPMYALMFLLPLIAVYELGTLVVNTDQAAQTLVQKRVVAFIWLSRLAEWAGVKGGWAWAFPGFVVVVLLVCWQAVSRRPWEVRLWWLGGMALESVVFALPLLALNAAIGSSVRTAAGGAGASSHLAQVVTGIGAGIYEELVFRFILVGLVLLLLEDAFHVKPPLPALAAVFISAGLFAAHHYVGVAGGRLAVLEPFTVPGFVFRALAGLYFALLFRGRGYGVAAGTHAAYDILLTSFWG